MGIAETIADTLEISDEILFEIPKITIIGDTKVRVENYTALLEYKKEDIKLKYKSGVIEICGENFEIKSICEENIVVSGKISMVRLI